MTDLITIDEFKSYVFNSDELKQQTDWPDSLTEEFMAIVEAIQILFNRKLEQTLTELLDNGVLIVKDSTIGIDSELLWDNTNKRLQHGGGGLELVSTGRVKIELIKDAFVSQKGASAPTVVLSQVGTDSTMLEPRLSFSSVTQQDAYFTFHMPENMDDTADIIFELMWKPGSSWTTGNYVWKLEYIIKNETDDSTTGASTTISADVTPANADDYIETKFSSTINADHDDVVSCHLYRDVASDNGNDVGEVRFFEMEYTSNKLGESI